MFFAVAPQAHRKAATVNFSLSPLPTQAHRVRGLPGFELERAKRKIIFYVSPKTYMTWFLINYEKLAAGADEDPWTMRWRYVRI